MTLHHKTSQQNMARTASFKSNNGWGGTSTPPPQHVANSVPPPKSVVRSTAAVFKACESVPAASNGAKGSAAKSSWWSSASRSTPPVTAPGSLGIPADFGEKAARGSNLLTLNLTNKGIDTLSIVALTTTIQSGPRVAKLSLAGNELKPDAIVCLAKLLRDQQCTLLELDLSNNLLSSADIARLATSLEVNTRLQKLHLNCVGLGDSDLVPLMALVRHNGAIRELSLNGNRVTNDGAERLYTAIHGNSSIIKLGLNDNPINNLSLIGRIEGVIDRNDHIGSLVDTLVVGAMRRDFRTRRIKTAPIVNKSLRGIPKELLKGGETSQAGGQVKGNAPVGPAAASSSKRARPAMPAWDAFQTDDENDDDDDDDDDDGEEDDSPMGASIARGVKSPMMSPRKLDARFRYGMAETIGMRADMQDVTVALGAAPPAWNFDYFAVFDGHGHNVTAKHAAEELHKDIGLRARKNPGDLATAVRGAMTSMHSELRLMPAHTYSGTTVLCCLIQENKRLVVNAGDSRAVLNRAGKAIRLSHDHKPEDPDETTRIMASGGFVQGGRVNGLLAVSRALGDGFFQPMVIADPYIHEDEIHPDDSFLILACDGVWDVLTDQEAVDIVSTELDPDAAAKALMTEALDRWSTDNISVCIVYFDGTMAVADNTADNTDEPSSADEEQLPGGE